MSHYCSMCSLPRVSGLSEEECELRHNPLSGNIQLPVFIELTVIINSIILIDKTPVRML